MKCAEFFHYALVVNQEEDVVCVEKREYKHLKNGEFLIPKNQTDKYQIEQLSYKFEVGPGETKAAFI